MPFRGQVPFDFQSILIKVGFVVGFLIIIYAILWMLAELKLMPVIIFAIFPQIVLLCVGIFILYMAYTKRKEYY